MNIETNKINKSKLNRWLIRLQPYDFKAPYITGIENVVADYLSRDGVVKPTKLLKNNQFIMKTKQKPVKVLISNNKTIIYRI